MNIIKNEKVVLLVTDGRDYTIKEVSEWIHYYSLKDSFRLVLLNTIEQKLQILKGELSSSSELTFGISNTDISFNLSSIKGIFIRQAGISIDGHTGVKSNARGAGDIKSRFGNYLMAYENNIRWLVLNCLSKTNIIGYDSSGFINKLEVLKVAAEIGLKIPVTKLVSNKNDLIEFGSAHDEIIVKSVGLGLAFIDLEEKTKFGQLTNVVTKKDYRDIPDHFNLSMVQNRVVKKFEIRTFVLDEICYSWALMSQSNDQTAVDYRNYDWNNPMRVIAFDLPEKIDKKIIELMQKLELRTGSIDLMYSTDNEFVFLEVNPAGQYGYNSDCSNYQLDRKIAQSLINENERKRHRVFHS